MTFSYKGGGRASFSCLIDCSWWFHAPRVIVNNFRSVWMRRWFVEMARLYIVAPVAWLGTLPVWLYIAKRKEARWLFDCFVRSLLTTHVNCSIRALTNQGCLISLCQRHGAPPRHSLNGSPWVAANIMMDEMYCIGLPLCKRCVTEIVLSTCCWGANANFVIRGRRCGVPADTTSRRRHRVEGGQTK